MIKSSAYKVSHIFPAGTLVVPMFFSTQTPVNTTVKNNNLNPYWVSGFCDGESSFIISLKQTPRKSWQVQAVFQIGLHIKDIALLEKIQSFFKGAGKIQVSTSLNRATYSVTKLKDLVSIIIPHFQQYNLVSVKVIDFQLWEKCIRLMERKEHLNKSGLENILSIRSVLNWGLTDKLKLYFPDIIPAITEYSISNNPLDPDWISGFSDGESSFYVVSNPNKVRVVFEIHLNERELPLINKIQNFFGGIGKIRLSSNSESVHYTIYNNSDLLNIVVPHFDKYRLEGYKLNNYLIWKEILLLVNSKTNLTPQDLNKIVELKPTLNK